MSKGSIGKRKLANAVASWNLLYPLAALSIGLTAWEAFARLLELPRYLLPAPSVIAQAASLRASELALDTLVTLLEAVAGFTAGSLAAFAVGTAFAQFRRVERAFSPIFVALQAVPLVAVAPLLIVWMGNGYASKVTMAAMICFFPMVVTTAIGLRQTPKDAEDLFTVVRASALRRFIKLRLPYSVPYLLAGLKVNAALAVIGAIVSELAGADRGIGYQILISSYKTDTPMLFAAIAFASAAGVSFYKVIEAIETMVTKRYQTT
ncbi:ABC transporter permease [Polaromonas sp.]|uniref:ABC transporter permease n=1 Tax=Polaromonas sp. TaxID=1869339 RepID=UPI00273209CB|nr:ABC transporter permease [Polaromonas sp.]MDP1740938.1 ABC transporter permease [Polaromonas sp.]